MKIQKLHTEQAQEVAKTLEENNYYCPCKTEQTPETKCPCKEFIESLHLGVCHCGLYEKTEI